MTITNASGAQETQYPLQFARPFVDGEIRDFPQVFVDGVPIKTQADVKQRYASGYVKHAVIAAIIPVIPATGAVTLSFGNQADGNNTPLQVAQMLDSKFNFDAQMTLTNGTVSKNVSARQMLISGKFKYWTSGSVATTIILADDSLARTFDLGFDGYKPFRPRFIATFFPDINKVRVRYIGEVSNTNETETINYDLNLSIGNSAPRSVFAQSAILHAIGARWTKEFWVQTAPARAINIDHNIGYLSQTAFFAHYDASLKIPESQIASWWNNGTNWPVGGPAIFSEGGWTKYMPTTGGRPDIGLLPTWSVLWIYSGDWRMREVSFDNADLAGTWQMNYREGNGSKRLLRTDNVDSGTGLGLPVSITDRPSISFVNGLNWQWTTPADRVSVVGPLTGNGWDPDVAHQPDPYSAQYILSGDPWYLEQSQMWAAWSAGYWNYMVRGPNGAYGGFIENGERDIAWLLRGRAIAAFISPDNDPFKKYLSTLVDDFVSEWEGYQNIKTSNFYQSELWRWGFAKSPQSGSFQSNNPLRVFKGGDNYYSTSYFTVAPWQEYFLICSLGRATEMGFSTGALLDWVAPFVIGQVATDATANPFLMSAYWIPAAKNSTTGTYYQTWGDVNANFLAAGRPPITSVADMMANGVLSNLEHGYANLGRTATSFVSFEPGGRKAWDWVYANTYVPIADIIARDPAWAITPRSINGSAIPTPTPTPTPAPTITLSGPSFGMVSVTSSTFSVSVNGTLSSTVTLTPSAGAGGGLFNPQSVQLSPLVSLATFTYLPSMTGNKTIILANNANLTNPPAFNYTVTASTASLPAWLSGKPLNVFVQVPGSAGTGGAPIDDYSGWTLRPSSSELFVAAVGGHGGSSDNRVVSINLLADAPAWVLRASASAVTSFDVAYNPDGKPASRHTYGSLLYVPLIDRIMLFGARFTGSSGISFLTVDGFDPTKNTWDPMKTYPDLPGGGYGSVVDAESNVWTQYVFQKWSAATNTWSTPISTKPNNTVRFPYAFDTKRNQIFGLQYGDGQGYDLASGVSALRVPVKGNSAITVTFNQSSAYSQFIADGNTGLSNDAGMDYDQTNDQFLFYSGIGSTAGHFYLITPNDTNVWDMSLLTVGAGSPVLPPSGSGGVNNRVSYIPSLKGFAIMPSSPAGIYFVKTANGI